VGGYWFWESNHYGWVRGHNVRGQEGAQWVAPRWEHSSSGYAHYSGHFVKNAAGHGAPAHGAVEHGASGHQSSH
jgi:hypothetical protein